MKRALDPAGSVDLALVREVGSCAGRFRDLWISTSPQDWLVLLYLTGLNVALWCAARAPGYVDSALRMGGLLGFFVVTLVLVRGRWLDDRFFGPLSYRIAIHGTVQTSYFFFAVFLPIVNGKDLDLHLYDIDLRYFGREAAVDLNRLVGPHTSEWFACFYFCYFLILALHSLPIVLFSRRQRVLGEFTLGMLLLFCIGHTVYMLVPGFGPYRAIPELLPSALPHGFWVDSVMATVAGGGAQKDIFPSLHTAAPTFIAMFSFRHRRSLPFKYTWAPVAFFAANIMVATMYLRWHWLVDVVAGLALSALSYWLSIVITDWDLCRRARLGLGPSWPEFGRIQRALSIRGAPHSAAPTPAQKPS